MTTTRRNAVCYSARKSEVAGIVNYHSMYVAESLAPVIRQSPFVGVPSKINFRLIFVCVISCFKELRSMIIHLKKIRKEALKKK